MNDSDSGLSKATRASPKKQGAKSLLREYFIAHVGEVLDSGELSEVAGTSE